MAKSHLTAEQQNVALQMSKVGLSQKKIADAFDVSQPTISNVLKSERLREELRQKDMLIGEAMSKGAVSFLKDANSSNLLSKPK